MPLTATRAGSAQTSVNNLRGGTECLLARAEKNTPTPSEAAHSAANWSTPLDYVKSNLPSGVRIVGDPSDWDCALIIDPTTAPSAARHALDLVKLLGLEPIPEEECEPELLDDGAVRMWLIPTDPEDPFTEA